MRCSCRLLRRVLGGGRLDHPVDEVDVAQEVGDKRDSGPGVPLGRDQRPQVLVGQGVEALVGLVEEQQVRGVELGQATLSFCCVPPDRAPAGRRSRRALTPLSRSMTGPDCGGAEDFEVPSALSSGAPTSCRAEASSRAYSTAGPGARARTRGTLARLRPARRPPGGSRSSPSGRAGPGRAGRVPGRKPAGATLKEREGLSDGPPPQEARPSEILPPQADPGTHDQRQPHPAPRAQDTRRGRPGAPSSKTSSLRHSLQDPPRHTRQPKPPPATLPSAKTPQPIE